MQVALFKFLHWCLDLIFPKFCLDCGQEGAYLCSACSESLLIAAGAKCFFCGRRSPTSYSCDDCRNKHESLLSGILIASDWNNLLLRQIIYEYKYRFIKELANPLSQLLVSFLKQFDFVTMFKCSNVNMILIPVPLHGRRLTWRGFNQAEMLAQKISDYFNIPLRLNILARQRHTLPQRKIKNENERAANIKNAFALRSPLKSDFKEKIIILVDDVCTTGATFEDCARALAPLMPKEIWGLVIARG